MTETPETAAQLTGADDELIAILDRDEALICTRAWEAWQYGTMSESDFVAYTFVPATESADGQEGGVAEILAWRDAAVRAGKAEVLRAVIADLNSNLACRTWEFLPDLRRQLAALEA